MLIPAKDKSTKEHGALKSMQNKLFLIYEPEIEKTIVVLSALGESSGEQKISQLANQVHMTNITVLQYLKEIQQYLKEIGSQRIQLEIINNQTLKWCLSDIHEYFYLRNYIVQKCSMIQLGLQLILGAKVNKVDFLNQLFLSESTFKRRLKNLKEIFSDHGLRVETTNGYLVLKGEEANIRRIARDALMDLFSEEQWPFGSINQQQVEESLENLLCLKELDVQQQKRVRQSEVFKIMKFDLAIQLSRFRSGHEIQLSDSVLANQEVAYLIEERHQLVLDSYRLSANERLFFIFSLLSKDLLYSLPVGQGILKSMQETDCSLMVFIQQAIELFSHEVLPITSAEQQASLPFFLSMHLNNLIYPGWEGSIHYKELSFRAPQMMVVLKNYLEKLQQLNPSMVVSPFTVLQRTYTQLIGYLENYSLKERELKLKIVGTRSELEYRLAETVIQKSFSFFYKIQFEEDAPDIVIHVNQYNHYKLDTHDIEQIHCFITSGFLDVDMNTIQKALFKAFVHKKQAS